MYKVTHNNKIVDLIKYPIFLLFLPTGHIAITNKAYAQGIAGSDGETVYSFSPIAGKNFLVVTIEEISDEEFRRLQSLLNSGQEITSDDSALTQAKQAKINQLSSLCRNKIIAGFSIRLSDENIYNFKLTPEDQLNLTAIENQLASDEDYFIYHATDEPCQVYSRDDMLKIVKAFKAHTRYHTTYFNAAKHYIKSLADIEKVNLFIYGTDISESVGNPVLKQILRNGEVSCQ